MSRGTTLISRPQTVAMISRGWRNPRLPPQQLRNAAGLCLDRRTILGSNLKNPTKNKKEAGPNQRHHKSHSILKRWPGLGENPHIPS